MNGGEDEEEEQLSGFGGCNYLDDTETRSQICKVNLSLDLLFYCCG